MFDLETFTASCRSALQEENSHAAVREIVAEAVSHPQQILRSLGEPKFSGIESSTAPKV